MAVPASNNVTRRVAATPLCSAASPLPSCSALPAAASSPLSPATVEALHAAARAKASCLKAQAELSSALAVLDQLVAEGQLAVTGLPVVLGFQVYRQEGRLSWQYPEAIQLLEGTLKKRKQLAEQLGEAHSQRGEPYWTIKASKQEGQP
jgi:hypothetical protein